jgi:hypothetical protein
LSLCSRKQASGLDRNYVAGPDRQNARSPYELAILHTGGIGHPPARHRTDLDGVHRGAGGADSGALPARPDPRRRGWSSRATSRRCRCAPACAPPARCSASTPLYVACEGRLLAVVAGADADRALAALRTHPLGAGAAVIGAVSAADGGPPVRLCTAFGASRALGVLPGAQLPRIC